MIINTHTSIAYLAVPRPFRLNNFTIVADRRGLIPLQNLKIALGSFLFELSRITEVTEKVRNKDNKAQNQISYGKVSIVFYVLAHNKAHV